MTELEALKAENHQLTVDLEELNLRLKMEAECHEQTVDDLERARAEVEARKLNWKKLCDKNVALADANERLKAALAKERGCDECWKGQSCGTDCHMNDIAQAALTETP